MIISHGRRYIFVHIPKTGGTSLALALEARAMADDIMLGDTPKAVKRRKRVQGAGSAGRLWKHSTLRDIEGLLSLDEITSFYTFTMVRNPWDRLVSYYHWLRAQSFDHGAVALSKSHDFSGFVNHPSVCNALAEAPYISYVTDPAGGQRCDLFIRLERLADDLPKLEQAIGVRLSPLGHVNKSVARPAYRDCYTPEDRDLVGRISAVDIARFGYRF